MPRLPYLTDAQGNPKNLRRIIAPQATLGIPTVATASLIEMRTNGGKIAPVRASIPRAVVSRSRQRPLKGKMTLTNGPIAGGDADPANRGMLRLLANHFGNYTVETVNEVRVGGGSFKRWTFSVSASTAADAYLSLIEDNDVIPRFLAYDLAVNQIEGAATAGENYKVNFGVVGGSHTFYSLGEQSSGTGSEVPVLIGTYSGNWALDSVDNDIYLKVSAQDSTTVTFLAKVSAAASYGAITFVVTRGEYAKIVDSNSGEFLAGEGSYTETPAVYASVGGTYATNDEFTFLNRIESFATSLGIERPISSVNTEFYVDGERFRSEGGWTYTSAWERGEGQQDVSFEQGNKPVRSGQILTSLNPTRELADLALQKIIHQGSVVSAYIDSATDVYIASTIRRYRWLAIFPSLQASGEMYGPDEGATNTQEAVTLETGAPESTFTISDPDQDIEIDDDFAIVIENDIASL